MDLKRNKINFYHYQLSSPLGEAICLDRCVSKYLDVHDRLGKLLTQMTQQDDKATQQQQQNLVAAVQQKLNK
jgi:hypothetical protein